MFNNKIAKKNKRKEIVILANKWLKDKQIHENKKYDFIDDLIVRSCDAPLVNKKNRFYEER